MRQEKKVSIIIPVYNVEKYIDQCIESVCVQTYSNLEIIIVYDASKDKSLLKCQWWSRKDSRILLIINQNRKGLGAARNVGLRIATGEYVTYIDSDDWMEKNYIESLYNTIEKTQSSYVSGAGYYGIKEKNDMRKYTCLPAGEYASDDEKAMILLKGYPAVWGKIYNRKWLIEEELFQPELFHYEDWGFDIPLIFKAKKITVIPQIGIFYRISREGCLSNDDMESLCSDYKKSIEFGLEQIEAANLLNKYRISIQKYLLRDFFLRKRLASSEKNENALQILKQIKIKILDKRLEYQDIDNYKRHICFGSFSLRWIVQQTIVFAPKLEYFGFSSIIAAITDGDKIHVENKNEFRVHQILQDVSGEFGKVIDNLKESSILFIDFLEERNNIIELLNRQYITQSEAYKESSVGGEIDNIILNDTDEFTELVREKCLLLVEKLNLKRQIIQIVLVKNRMALRYGNLYKTQEYKELHDLKRCNARIEAIEKFFLQKCDEYKIPVEVFELPEKFCFTDETFCYGCIPQYMNWALYTNVGSTIFDKYMRRKWEK